MPSSRPALSASSSAIFISLIKCLSLIHILVPCTGCRYCMPCPVGVDIPGIFKIRNEGAVFDAPTSAKAAYGRMQPENRQTACVRCGRCATLCPQHISIPEKLAEAHAYLTAE